MLYSKEFNNLIVCNITYTIAAVQQELTMQDLKKWEQETKWLKKLKKKLKTNCYKLSKTKKHIPKLWKHWYCR